MRPCRLSCLWKFLDVKEKFPYQTLCSYLPKLIPCAGVKVGLREWQVVEKFLFLGLLARIRACFSGWELVFQ